MLMFEVLSRKNTLCGAYWSLEIALRDSKSGRLLYYSESGMGRDVTKVNLCSDEEGPELRDIDFGAYAGPDLHPELMSRYADDASEFVRDD
jgi:hypothetical protein